MPDKGGHMPIPQKTRITARAKEGRDPLEERLRQAEQRLREFEERHAMLMSAINEIVYDWDITLDRLSCSENMQRILGSPAGAVRTFQDWCDRIHPDDLRSHRAAVAEHFEARISSFEI